VFQEPKQPETQTDPQMYLVIRLKVSRAWINLSRLRSISIICKYPVRTAQ
jgi:hypothetical protein